MVIGVCFSKLISSCFGLDKSPGRTGSGYIIIICYCSIKVRVNYLLRSVGRVMAFGSASTPHDNRAANKGWEPRKQARSCPAKLSY